MKKYLLSLVLFVITTSMCQAQNPLLWGMTSGGGTNDSGIIFSYDISTAKGTVLYNFTGGADGAFPIGSLLQVSDSLLYGMTYVGGTYDSGTVINYNINTGKETVLHSFGGGTDGTNPEGTLIQATNGWLYGMTYQGGTEDTDGGDGTIFSYNWQTQSETVLHSFVGWGSDGNGPTGNFIQVGDSLLYGLTAYGAYNNGTIISYNIYTGKETLLHSFGIGNDGFRPYGSLIRAKNGWLYGMTEKGGINNEGIIFSYDISTGTETVQFNFGGASGTYPEGSLIQASDSLLYGMTDEGGGNGYGTIFSYDITTGKESVLHSFGSGTDGEYPEASLLQVSDTMLYGMTNEGGEYDLGTFFSYNIYTGIETDLHDFKGGADGEYPYGDVIEDNSATSGINQLSLSHDQLSIYPNPTSGQFTIKTNGNQSGYTVEVYNLMGEEVYQSTLSGSQNNIDLSSQPAGLYFVYLKSGEGVEVGKVLVTK